MNPAPASRLAPARRGLPAHLAQLFLPGLDPLSAYLPRTFVDLKDLHKVSGPPSPAPHILARLLPPSAWPGADCRTVADQAPAGAAPVQPSRHTSAALAVAPGWPGKARKPHPHHRIAPGDTQPHQPVPGRPCWQCGNPIRCLRCFHWTDSVCRSALVAARARRIAAAMKALD